MVIPFDTELLELLRAADSISVLTGAGVSAESGIPTFRDAMSSLWARFDPADLATPDAFARDPQLVSRWYDERRCNVANAVRTPVILHLPRYNTAAFRKGAASR